MIVDCRYSNTFGAHSVILNIINRMSPPECNTLAFFFVRNDLYIFNDSAYFVKSQLLNLEKTYK